MSERHSIDTVLLDEEIFESIVGWGIEAEEVEARIEKEYRELARIEEPILYLTACCEASDAGVVRSWIRTALSDAGILGVTPKLQVRWFRSARERREEEVRSIVETAIKPSTQFYATDIGILLSGDRLDVRVVSRSFMSRNKASRARQKIEQFKDEILNMTGAQHMFLCLEDGMQSFPQHCAGDLGHDVDDEVNPNWPSKTGNLSGGGRGNNPPKR